MKAVTLQIPFCIVDNGDRFNIGLICNAYKVSVLIMSFLSFLSVEHIFHIHRGFIDVLRSHRRFRWRSLRQQFPQDDRLSNRIRLLPPSVRKQILLRTSET